MKKSVMPPTFTWFLVMIAISVLVFSCTRKLTQSSPDQTKEQEIGGPEFNRDSATSFVAKQVDFGPRVAGTEAHKQCAEYLYKTLSIYAQNVEYQEFKSFRWDGVAMQGKNIIASFNVECKERVLLAAHWDSRPYADQEEDPALHKKAIGGANDGASGVGVLLEVARILHQKAPWIGVDIILFDLEDAGTPQQQPYKEGNENTWCKGAQYWATHLHKPAYTARFGILLDMVGASQAIFAHEATSVYYAQDVLDKVWDVAEASGYGHLFVRWRTGGVIDDHLFVNKMTGIPMIDIIHYDRATSTGFFPAWHTMEDNMSQIDPSTLEAVGEVVLKTIYNER